MSRKQALPNLQLMEAFLQKRLEAGLLDPARWWFYSADINYGLPATDRLMWVWGHPTTRMDFDHVYVLEIRYGEVHFFQTPMTARKLKELTPDELTGQLVSAMNLKRREDVVEPRISEILRGFRVDQASQKTIDAYMAALSPSQAAIGGLVVDEYSSPSNLGLPAQLPEVAPDGIRQWFVDFPYTYALVHGGHLQAGTQPSQAEVQAMLGKMMESGLSVAHQAMAQDGFGTLSGQGTYTATALNYYNADGEDGLRRRRTAFSFPTLVPYFPDNYALDRGARGHVSMQEAVSEWLQVPVSSTFMRRIRNIPDDGYQALSFKTCAKALDGLPPDWVPQTAQQGRALLSLANMSHQYNRMAGLTTPANRFLKHSGGDWSGFMDKLRQAVRADDSDLFSRNTTHFRMEHENQRIRDTVRAFTNQVYIPLLTHLGELPEDAIREDIKALTHDAAEVLIGEKGWLASIELSNRFHDTLERRDARMPVQTLDNKGSRWPAAFEDYIAPNGLRMTMLTTSLDLTEEGAQGPDRNGVPGLHHCVGGYSHQCVQGISHIMSIREVLPDGSYRRLSTVEFRFDKQPERVGTGVRQHYGIRDTNPPPEAEAALSAFMRDIRANLIPINPEALMERTASGKLKGKDDLEIACRYNWRVRENIQQALVAWESMLPRSWRGKTLEEVAELALGRPLQARLSPEEALMAEEAEPEASGFRM